MATRDSHPAHSAGAGAVLARRGAAARRILTESAWPVATLLAILTLSLRWPLLSHPFTYDEWATVDQHVSQPVLVIVTTFGAARNHPLYSLASHVCWRVHESELSCRIPAFVAGLVAVPFLWLSLRGRVGEVPAVAAAVGLATSAPHVAYSAQARGYAFVALGTIVANWSLLAAVQGGRWRAWAAYAAVMALTAYSHLWGLLLLAGHGVFVVWRFVERRLRPDPTPPASGRELRSFAIAATVALAIVAIAYAAMLSDIVGMLGQERERPFAQELPASIAWLLDLSHPDATFVTWFFVALAVVIAAIGRRFVSRPLAMLGASVVVTSFVLVALVRPANFYARFLIFWIPCLLMVAASTADAFPLLARSRTSAIAMFGRPNAISTACAMSAVALVLVALVVNLVGYDPEWPGARYGIASKLAWSGAVSIAVAQLCGGVTRRFALWLWLCAAAAAGYVALDLVVSIKDPDVWAILAVSAGVGLIVWTAVTLRAKLLDSQPLIGEQTEPEA